MTRPGRAGAGLLAVAVLAALAACSGGDGNGASNAGATRTEPSGTTVPTTTPSTAQLPVRPFPRAIAARCLQNRMRTRISIMATPR